MTILSGTAGFTTATKAQQAQVIRNTFGEVGLLDMPSAHMAPDGQFGFSIGDVGNYQRYAFSFQRWPWLETAFRYSRVPYWVGNKIFYDRSIGAKARLFDEADDFADVSVGVRDVLGTGVYGSEYIVASKHIGAFDVTAGLGWGRLASNNTLPNPFGEIISSFKTRTHAGGTGLVDFGQFFHGPKTGVFGGLAWQTPIDQLSVIAEYSSDQYTIEREDPHGLHPRSPVNVGLAYHPFDFLSLSAGWMYGDTYGFTLGVSGDPTTTFSKADRLGPDVPAPEIRSQPEQEAALKYLHFANVDISAARAGGPWVQVPTPKDQTETALRQAFYAESSGVRDIDLMGTTLIIDAHQANDRHAQCARYAELASASGAAVKSIAMSDLYANNASVTFCPVGTPVQQAYDQVPAQTEAAPDGKWPQLTRAVARDLAGQDVLLDGFSDDNSELWLYYENGRYREESEAIGRITRVLMADAPSSIEVFHIVSSPIGVPSRETTIIRSALERAIANYGDATQASGAVSLKSPPLDNPALDNAVSSIFPRFTWSIDPRISEHLFDPQAPLQWQLYAEGNASLQLSPGLFISTDLTANVWNNLTFTRPAGSVLPHVRTDLLQYLKDGQYGISSLGATYRTKLAPDLFAEAKLGYLEDMFMGGGGDILWRPDDSRFAFGADLYQVWKRNFNRLFGAQRYNILTGHVSVYYASPWQGVNYALHVGRYLAGDYGGTLEITRRFSTGVEIGAWATITTVPFSKFGEGSFDKGIIIHIPFEWGLPVYSQASYDLHLASLTRDGGQRLANDDSLFQETRRTSDGEILQHLDDITEP